MIRLIMESSCTQHFCEDTAMRRYCEKTIRNITRAKDDCEPREINNSRNADCGEAAVVPLQLTNLVKMKAFRDTLKRAAAVELHDPGHCRSCQVKQAELARDDFIRRKMTQLRSPLLEGEIQSRWLNRNSICVIGEAIRELPRPTEDPALLWQALKARQEKLAGHKDTPVDLSSARVRWDLACGFEGDT